MYDGVRRVIGPFARESQTQGASWAASNGLYKEGNMCGFVGRVKRPVAMRYQKGHHELRQGIW